MRRASSRRRRRARAIRTIECREGARKAPWVPPMVWQASARPLDTASACGQMAQPLHAQPLVDPLRLDELAEDRDVLVLLANAVGNPLTLLVAILPGLKAVQSCRTTRTRAAVVSPFRGRITDAAVTAIVARFPKITSLKLQNCKQITDSGGKAVAKCSRRSTCGAASGSPTRR